MGENVPTESASGAAGSGPGVGFEKPYTDWRGIARSLTESEFNDGIRLTGVQLATLHDIASGKVRRHAGAMIQAIRTQLEWGHAKPRQDHELSGNVTITVASTLPGPPGSGALVTVAETPLTLHAHDDAT